MSDGLGKLVGTAVVLSGIAFGINVLAGGEGYNGQHADQFREALTQKAIVHVVPDSNRRLSFATQEEFYKQFLRDHGLMQIDGKSGIYDSEGNKVPYKTLSGLVKEYNPSR